MYFVVGTERSGDSGRVSAKIGQDLRGEQECDHRRKTESILRFGHERGGDVRQVIALMRKVGLGGQHGCEDGMKNKGIFSFSFQRGGNAGQVNGLMRVAGSESWEGM